MFNWFWEFLYGLSRSIFRIIDGLLSCANMLCGIDPITINGEETDIITFLFRDKQIMFAFRVTVILGTIILVVFTIIAIIRLIIKEKPDESPAQLCIKAFKNILLFMFVPFLMLVIIQVLNVFMLAIYKGTLAGNSQGMGNFLFVAFGSDAAYTPDSLNGFLDGTLSYLDMNQVNNAIDISDFDFFASWIAGAVILVNVAWSLLIFVDRAISLVVLFLLSPFSIASSILDGGSRFKLWRDQVMSKFVVGYGTIITLNVYILVVAAIMQPGVSFFPDSNFLNYLMKILFILGGAMSMKKAMALVGNLVSQGAGSQELRDTAFGRGQLMRGIGSAISGGGKALLGGTRAALHPSTTASNALGSIKSAFGYGGPSAQQQQLSASNKTNELLSGLLNGGNDSKFTGGTNNSNSSNSMKDTISSSGKNNNNDESNANNNKQGEKMSNTVKDSLQNSGMKGKEGDKK